MNDGHNQNEDIKKSQTKDDFKVELSLVASNHNNPNNNNRKQQQQHQQRTSLPPIFTNSNNNNNNNNSRNPIIIEDERYNLPSSASFTSIKSKNNNNNNNNNSPQHNTPTSTDNNYKNNSDWNYIDDENYEEEELLSISSSSTSSSTSSFTLPSNRLKKVFQRKKNNNDTNSIHRQIQNQNKNHNNKKNKKSKERGQKFTFHLRKSNRSTNNNNNHNNSTKQHGQSQEQYLEEQGVESSSLLLLDHSKNYSSVLQQLNQEQVELKVKEAESNIIAHHLAPISMLPIPSSASISPTSISSINNSNSNNNNNNNNNSNTMRNNNICQCIMKIFIYQNPILKCIVSIPTIADHLPPFMQSILIHNTKFSFLALFLLCIILNLVFIFPGYILSFLITEVGVYITNIALVWFLGRFIVRMIAFPGSTSRVSNEIENEFTKYSFRMIKNANDIILDLCMLLMSLDEVEMYLKEEKNNIVDSNGVLDDGEESRDVNVFGSPKKGTSLHHRLGHLNQYNHMKAGHSDIIASWKKVEQYRNRILGMYFDVLHCLLHENGQGLESEENKHEWSTKYANNRLVGDIGNIISNITTKAFTEGQEVYELLKRVLSDLDDLEKCTSSLFKAKKANQQRPLLSVESIQATQKLLTSITKLNDCVSSLSPQKSSSNLMVNVVGADSPEKRTTRGLLWNNEIVTSIFSTIDSIISLFDPKPHKSIFGFDVLRGTMLSRYKGSRQLWFPRPKSEGGGMIDVIHIPSSVEKKTNGSSKQVIDKAVMFCGPNAGLIEVATGISLIGGNVGYGGASPSWTDFYIENGFDVFLFNYSGFGRSYVGKQKVSNKPKSQNPVFIMGRILYNSVFGFKPKPSSLKADALAVATHMIKEFSIDNLVIHGESIGGMAASSAARHLSSTHFFDDLTSAPKAYPTLLICDRTFCNLNAVASHLVGSWTTPIIPILTPFWNTDVAGDYISSTCRKVVAQDAADAIIHYSSSLQRGISIAKELQMGSTQGLDRVLDTPFHYRIADFENVGLFGSKIATIKPKQQQQLSRAPVWPADKHIDLKEAFHFAACARRIGKVATAAKKRTLNSLEQSTSYDNSNEDEEGIEITTIFSREANDNIKTVDNQHQCDPLLVETKSNFKDETMIEVWETLARCDGLTGYPLGAAVKEGDDCVIDWLSCLVIFGCQRVALEVEKRIKSDHQDKSANTTIRGLSIKENIDVKPTDFEFIHYERDGDDHDDDHDDDMKLPPLPLPSVITSLSRLFQEKDHILDIDKELEYCLKMLEYILTRITSKTTIIKMLQECHFQMDTEKIIEIPSKRRSISASNSSSSANNGISTEITTEVTVGRFLNLTCGHNNQYSLEEQMELIEILNLACDHSNSFA